MSWVISPERRRAERASTAAVFAKVVTVVSAAVLFLIVGVAFSSAWITEKQWAAGYDSDDPFWVSQAAGPRHGISEHYSGDDPWGFAMTYWGRYQLQSLWVFVLVLAVMIVSWLVYRRLKRAAGGLATSVLTSATKGN